MRLKRMVAAATLLIFLIIVAMFVILSRYDFNDLKPHIVRMAKKATGRDLILAGSIDLKIGFKPKLMVENVSFQNALWGSRPEMVKVRRVEVQVALLPLISKNIEIKRLVLVEPDILIETDKAGKTNFEFKISEKDADPKLKEAEPSKIELPVLIFEDLQLEKGKLTYKDARKNKTLDIGIESLKVQATDPESPLTLNFKGDFDGTPFEVASRMGALTKLVDPDKDWALTLTAKAVGTILNLEGTIQDLTDRRSFETRFSLVGQDLANIEQVIGKPIPFKGPFNISAHLIGIAPDIYKVSDLKTMIGENSINGSLEANLSGKVPKLSASFSSQTLDLRPFFPKKGNKNGKVVETSKPQREKVFPRDQFPIESLKSVDAEVELRIGRLLTPRLAASDFKSDMSLKSGYLVLKPIKAVIGGGTLNGYVDFKAKHKTGAMSAAIKIDQLDMGDMLQDLNITDLLYGRMDMDINIKGQGESIAKTMAELNGNIRIVMNNGRINNKYINLLGGDLASGVYRLVNPLKEQTDYTEIRCFVSLFDIKDGRADCTALVLSTDNMNVIGDGEINLKTEKIDFSLKPLPKEGIVVASMSLGELTKPFKLKGTLTNPSLGIDPTQTAITIGKAAGGVILFGPFGIAAVLIGGKSDDENPCLTAIEKAQKRVKTAKEKPPEEKGAVTKTIDGAEESIKGFGKKLKVLFGD
ncbi:AsmA family protein [Thermodesulfobacteriota bacterium]